MRPLRIEIEGFGTFRERVELDFNGVELFALVGATGAGKSTVIDAITFALYGSVVRYDDNKVVVSAVNQTSTRARVQLDFEVLDRTYTAVRVVQRTTPGKATTKEARLESDGSSLAADARSMTSAVNELLGLDVDQFNRTVVLPQGRFAEFLHDKPADRQKTLRKLLGFEVYSRIGQAARDRCKEERVKAGAIASEVEARQADLTDERRDEIADRLERSRAVAVEIDGQAAQLAALERQAEPLRLRLGRLTANISALSAVSVPDDLGEIAASHASTRASLAAAREARDTTRAAAEAASLAVGAGPDLGSVKLLLARRSDHGDAAGALEGAQHVASDAARALEAAFAGASAVADRQQLLDGAVAEAQQNERAAREARDAAPSVAMLDAQRQLHLDHAAAIEQLATAKHAVSEAKSHVAPLEAALRTADEHVELARAAYEEAQLLGGVSAIVASLQVGEPCPVCRHVVTSLPDHDPSAELAAAKAALSARLADADRTRADHQAATGTWHRAQATLDEREARAASAAKALVGVPSPAELDEQRADAERLESRARESHETFTNAQSEADRHRQDPANLETLASRDAAREQDAKAGARVAALREQLATLERALVDAPDEATLRAQIATAEQLLAASQTATKAQKEAEQLADAAQLAADRARDVHAGAVRGLVEARERVVTLGAPAVSGEDLVADWDALATWATAAHAELQAEAATATTEHDQLHAEIEAITAAIRTTCAEVLEVPPEETTTGQVQVQLASLTSELMTRLETFDRDVEALAGQRRRIAELEESASVAERLGYLLRTDQFEEWLMGSALATLADSASARLRQLSSGQFSLELHDSNFMVRDHANADELRSAKTLSGGETFLASLSLALALADATGELAAEGAPPIESVFLDEGFGTLDPTTLDTVAAAIEELGASGRLVGIVTHIQELADRMPVRFEVSKAGGTSKVERVES